MRSVKKYSQLTQCIVMVRPDHFSFNYQTAESNFFQKNLNLSQNKIKASALAEFNTMVSTLRKNGLTVLELPSRSDVITPDAVFPNNWFSTHDDGSIVLYPMLTDNRRAERQLHALQSLLLTIGIRDSTTHDFSLWENDGDILEGTGSIVLDRGSHVAFAMESPRTTKRAFSRWCTLMEYEGFFFQAYDQTNLPIYHTNVFMSIGDKFAVAGIDAIPDSSQRRRFVQKLHDLGKEVIPITIDQLYKFCGNILQVQSSAGSVKIVLSTTAFQAFTKDQRKMLSRYGELLPVNIHTIETIGGGSARCMMSEIFFPV